MRNWVTQVEHSFCENNNRIESATSEVRFAGQRLCIIQPQLNEEKANEEECYRLPHYSSPLWSASSIDLNDRVDEGIF